MALAATIILIYKETGGGGGGTYPYSWISKAKATGLNKHMIWILAFFLWRNFKC